MADRQPWLVVDRKGLAAQLERRSKSFVLFELIQNALDEETTHIDVSLEPSETRGHYVLQVNDDSPDGFADLAHAWTMFAFSPKAKNPEKRGRFDVGEKFVLALCKWAEISSTTGSVIFDEEEGRTHYPRRKRDAGTRFRAIIKMSRDEAQQAIEDAHRIILPEHVQLIVNGSTVEHRQAVAAVRAMLPTEYADEDGRLHRTVRTTMVEAYERRPGEPATVFEMGIPVCETGGDDRWHYNVCQRVPLSVDRDSVTPAYLKNLRVHTLNALHEKLRADDAASVWAREAGGDTRVAPVAFGRLQSLRFGEKRVMFDPSDLDANQLAASKGYTVIPAGALTRDEHERNRALRADPETAWATSRPAGQVTPSPQPYSEGGKPLPEIPEKDWTPGMWRVATYASALSAHMINHRVRVQIVLGDIGWRPLATFGPGSPLTLNLRTLGHRFFDSGTIEEVTELLIHEFAHQNVGEHLMEKFHRECCRLGAMLPGITLTYPEIFKDFEAKRHAA